MISWRRLAIVGCCMALSAVGGCDRRPSQPSGVAASPNAAGDSAGGRRVIAMLPKLVNIDYFDACQRGAKRAADELGVELIYDGPNEASGTEQNKFIETWIRQGVSAICVAPNQPQSLKRFVAKAHESGIKVVTWDTDAVESGRDLMIAQVDDRLLGETLIDELARQMGESGEWAIAIASLDAANLNNWRRYAEARAKVKYPDLKLVATEVTKENENEARQRVESLLNAHPKLKGVLAFDSNSVPGACEAVKRAGKVGQVAVVGNSVPNKMRPYLKDGTLECFFLWDPRLLGELAVRAAKALADGQSLKPGDTLEGWLGPLRFSESDPSVIIMSDPIRFTKDNIDDFDFGI